MVQLTHLHIAARAPVLVQKQSSAMIFLILLALGGSQVKGDWVADIQTALNLGNSTINYTREGCIWSSNTDPAACPSPLLRFVLYTGKNRREVIDFHQADWLQHSGWDATLDNVVLIHGYAGGDNTFPMSMLRDAYLRNGSYNVILVDWGVFAALPCYPAAVHNLRTVARCTADVFAMLRDAAPGGRTKTTCIGHSLGAHLCGLISDNLRFRIHRIIGLDPAKPLVRNANRLRPGSADVVQVIHSNAGTYGESGKLGKVDFCLNGGKIQPLCETQDKADLCSHVASLCFMAASIDARTAPEAFPCARRCPAGSRPTHRLGIPIPLGEHAPQSASGFYCVQTKSPPYCPRNPGDPGHSWCCLDESSQQQTLETPAPPLDDPDAPKLFNAEIKNEGNLRRAPTFIYYSK